VYLPLLKEKVGYASLENLGDAVVGAAKLGLKDAALYKTLLNEIKKRPRDYKLVQQGTWNHGECQEPQDEPGASSLIAKLREAAPMLSGDAAKIANEIIG
jgi:hypothetical protein